MERLLRKPEIAARTYLVIVTAGALRYVDLIRFVGRVRQQERAA